MSTVIEVFADVVCPFTHVGLKRLVARRHELGRDDVKLWVRAWPLELVNGEPVAADHAGDEIDALRRTVAPGMFERFSVDRFPRTSLPALALAASAYAASLDAGERVSLAIRDRLFERGLDIGDPAVLADLADEHRLPITDPVAAATVRADLEEGSRRGVVGSPHFFTPGGDFFCPALDITRDEAGEWHIAPDDDSFERFVRSCFAKVA